MLQTLYFGTQKKFKNPFKKCKNNKDIFDLHRRIQMEQKSFLNRMCIINTYNNDIRLKGNAAKSEILK